jgi:hypothetical protein
MMPRTRQVQNRAAIAANATQHEIVQEAAERQRLEDKAGKQLERVQQQMALYVMPFGVAQVRRRDASHRRDTVNLLKQKPSSPPPPPHRRKECCL